MRLTEEPDTIEASPLWHCWSTFRIFTHQHSYGLYCPQCDHECLFALPMVLVYFAPLPQNNIQEARGCFLTCNMAHIARNVTESVLLDGPALQPPPGVVANVTNRSDEQFWYYVCISVCTVIPGNLLCLRFYTKLRIIRKVDLTDCASESFQISLVPSLTSSQI